MKKTPTLLVALFSLLSFNSSQFDIHPTQAWYETGIEHPLDENIRTSVSGKFYFEIHTTEQPKILNGDHFYVVKNNPKDYFTSYLINTTDTTIVVSRQDGSVMMIQEAKDSAGKWTPIEYWQHSGCGNSYFNPLHIEKNQYVMIPIKKYQGDFKTEMRLKLSCQNQIIYSDSFQGSVNKNQFKSDLDNSKLFGLSYLDEPGW
jgi:hypothetical protein